MKWKVRRKYGEIISNNPKTISILSSHSPYKNWIYRILDILVDYKNFGFTNFGNYYEINRLSSNTFCSYAFYSKRAQCYQKVTINFKNNMASFWIKKYSTEVTIYL